MYIFFTVFHIKWASYSYCIYSYVFLFAVYVTYLPYSFSFNSSSLCFIVCHQCFICDTIAGTQTENACSQWYKTSFSLHSSTMNKNIYNRYAIHDNIQQFTFVLAVGTFPLATRKFFADERSRESKMEKEKKNQTKRMMFLNFASFGCFIIIIFSIVYIWVSLFEFIQFHILCVSRSFPTFVCKNVFNLCFIIAEHYVIFIHILIIEYCKMRNFILSLYPSSVFNFLNGNIMDFCWIYTYTVAYSAKPRYKSKEFSISSYIFITNTLYEML